jgi:hypothetical protein
VPTGSVTLTSRAPAQGVPAVYNVAATDGLNAIRSAGYVAFAYRVCSHSVAADRIRQVVKADGTVLVEVGGTTAGREALATASVVGRQSKHRGPLLVAISCSAPVDTSRVAASSPTLPFRAPYRRAVSPQARCAYSPQRVHWTAFD